MARKTFSIDVLKNKINARLADPNVSQETKQELCVMLSNILMEADAYKGFNFIKWLTPNGWKAWMEDGQPTNTALYTGPEWDRFFY